MANVMPSMHQHLWQRYFYWVLFFIGWIAISSFESHPLYISVLEIEHNKKEQQLEISCRIFTNDFEATLRKYHKEKIDLLSPKLHDQMGVLMDGYIQKHLSIITNSKKSNLHFIGFEQADESVELYYEVTAISDVKSISVNDDILYDAQPKQMSLIHVTVNGERKSTRLNNPDSKADFEF